MKPKYEMAFHDTITGETIVRELTEQEIKDFYTNREPTLEELALLPKEPA